MTEHAKCRGCGGAATMRLWPHELGVCAPHRFVACECGWTAPIVARRDEAAAWAEWDRVMGGSDAK